MKFIKLIPSKLLATLLGLTYPKGISLEDCVIVSHIILLQFTRSYKVENNMVEIPSVLFGFALLSKNYKKVLIFMEQNQLIQTDTHQHGVKSKSYCIHPNQFDIFGGIVEYEIQDSILNKKTQKAIDITKQRKIMKNNIKASQLACGYIQQLKYDDVSAMDWLKHLYDNKIEYRGEVLTPQTYMIIQSRIKMLKLGNKEPSKYRYCKRNEINGRVDSDITTLNTNFRRFIIGDNLYNIDCVSSQPGLILVLIEFLENPLKFNGLLDYLKKIMESNVDVIKIKDMSNKIRYRKSETEKCLENLYKITLPSKSEILKYKKLIESGNFYEHFMSYLINNRNEILDRNDMKKRTYQVLYNDGIMKFEKDLDFLKYEFPSISKFIQSIKNVFIESTKRQNSNKKTKLARMFPVLMQAIESHIWIDTIIPKLEVFDMIYYSIHDSVLVSGKNKDIAKKIIEDTYNNFGINPKIKVEDNSTIVELKIEKIIKKQGFEL